MVLGRSGAFVSAFNKLLQQEAAVQKYYRALTRRPPPVGTPHGVLCHPSAECGAHVVQISC